MYTRVLYLVPSPESEGYVFPNEVDDKEGNFFYDFAASAVFAVKQPNHVIISEDYSIDNGKLKRGQDTLAPFHPLLKYTIKAIEDGIPIDYPMTPVSGNLYVVKTEKYGHFYFELIPDFCRYTGKEMDECILCLVKPLDIILLENVCKEHRFFFVGENKPTK